jgi:hypothetical protein
VLTGKDRKRVPSMRVEVGANEKALLIEEAERRIQAESQESITVVPGEIPQQFFSIRSTFILTIAQSLPYPFYRSWDA